MITAERLRDLLHYNALTGIFTWKVLLSLRAPVGAAAGHSDKRGRVIIGIEGHNYLAHRLAWLYTTGRWPASGIDHKDGEPSNNRFKNLRCATQAQNTKNSRGHRDSASGIKGVRYIAERRKWEARLMSDGRFRLLKKFATKAEAVEAYRAAALKYHGEFARVA